MRLSCDSPPLMGDLKDRVLTLGHSPDPDDAFMFYAMAEGLIDLRGYRFEHILQDIQTLNERALRGELDLTAVSVHALAHILDKYAVLPSGASMGDGYGPMFVAMEAPGDGDAAAREWLEGRLVAIPGEMTSAYLAAKLFMGGDFPHVCVPFDEIFEAVRCGRVEAGLLIHEGQLTYAAEGFSKIVDLGEWWTRTRGLPLPLGCNVIHKDIPHTDRLAIRDIFAESIAYGLAHRPKAVAHSMTHARGLDTALADEFIGMYVNELTVDYGDRGRAALRGFLSEAAEAGHIPVTEIEFV